jgi:GMP synthase (glutamine-hydrolysing)
MRALAIVHQPDAGPGVFAEAFAERKVKLDQWLIADGDPPADPHRYDAVMTFGGAMDAHQEEQHPWLRDEKALLAELLERGTPLIGVCLGAQLVAEAAGATPQQSSEPEIGWRGVELTDEGVKDPLLAPLAPHFTAFQWHSFEAPLPPGAVSLATSPVCLQAFRIGDAAYGIQFHAEVTADDIERWIDDYRSDPAAVTKVDPEELRQQSRAAIGYWNQTGRELCERFIDAVGG